MLKSAFLELKLLRMVRAGDAHGAGGTGSASGAVGARKVVSGHYARADSLDKKKLKKYVKALATEAKLYRNARNRD